MFQVNIAKTIFQRILKILIFGKGILKNPKFFFFIDGNKNEMKNNEKTPSSIPISSYFSLNKRLESLKMKNNYNNHEDEIESEKNKDDENSKRKFELNFTKFDLQRRLMNLRRNAEKFICKENSLPGDFTIKYALKYRRT